MFKLNLSRQDKKELVAGIAAFILASFLVVFIGARKNVGEQRAGTYLLTARFNTTDGLGVGGDVRVAGINVGKVVSQKLDSSYGVIVTMGVKKNVRLPDDSSASIQSNSLIGTKYIEIVSGGSDDFLPENGEIVYTEDAINILNLVDKALSMAKNKKEGK